MLHPTIASCVKLSEDVLIQELQGDAVLLDLKTGVYFGLDRVGTRIWHLLGERKVIGSAIEAMTQEFDVSVQQCTGDVLDLVTRLSEQNLVTVE